MGILIRVYYQLNDQNKKLKNLVIFVNSVIILMKSRMFQLDHPIIQFHRQFRNVSLLALQVSPFTLMFLTIYLVYYWYRHTLNISDGITNFGGVQIDMLLVLLIAWVIIFYTMMNGSETVGAKLYFIAFRTGC